MVALTQIVETDNSWSIELERIKPLFELKLVRFGYRYKYEDGEYSSFSPWSASSWIIKVKRFMGK